MATDPGDPIRRAELGRFLRTRRSAIRPEERGLTAGPRRRATGLLREEVAGLAGLSTTWYTFLEQGRPIHPSISTLAQVADVLGLSEDDRRYMATLAFGHLPGPPPETDEPAGGLAAAITAQFNDCAHPFYVVNHYGEVIDWNGAAIRWYTDFAGLPGRRSLMLWILTSPQARQRLGDWEHDARDMVARLRGQFAERPEDARMQAAVRELLAASPDFRLWWGEHRVLENRTRMRRLHHPDLGVRVYYLTALRPTVDSIVSYVMHLPVGPGQGSR